MQASAAPCLLDVCVDGTRQRAHLLALSPPHTQVRDQLTTAHEQELLRQGEKTSPTLSRDAVLVDAVVNTGKCSGSADE